MYLQVKRSIKKVADKGQGQEGKRQNVVMVWKISIHIDKEYIVGTSTFRVTQASSTLFKTLEAYVVSKSHQISKEKDIVPCQSQEHLSFFQDWLW